MPKCIECSYFRRIEGEARCLCVNNEFDDEDDVIIYTEKAHGCREFKQIGEVEMRNKTPEKVSKSCTLVCWNCGAQDVRESNDGAPPKDWFSVGVAKSTEMMSGCVDQYWSKKVSQESRFCCANCMLAYLSTEVK